MKQIVAVLDNDVHFSFMEIVVSPFLHHIPFCILRISEWRRDRQGQRNTKVEKSQFPSAKSITTLEMFDLETKHHTAHFNQKNPAKKMVLRFYVKEKLKNFGGPWNDFFLGRGKIRHKIRLKSK